MQFDIPVIVPAYNVEKYVAEAIGRILKKDFLFFELTIVNEESSDTSLEVCRRYSNDSHISIVNQSNSGVSIVRNMDLQKLDIIYFFMDADYMIAPAFFL